MYRRTQQRLVFGRVAELFKEVVSDIRTASTAPRGSMRAPTAELEAIMRNASANRDDKDAAAAAAAAASSTVDPPVVPRRKGPEANWNSMAGANRGKAPQYHTYAYVDPTVATDLGSTSNANGSDVASSGASNDVGKPKWERPCDVYRDGFGKYFDMAHVFSVKLCLREFARINQLQIRDSFLQFDPKTQGATVFIDGPSLRPQDLARITEFVRSNCAVTMFRERQLLNIYNADMAKKKAAAIAGVSMNLEDIASGTAPGCDGKPPTEAELQAEAEEKERRTRIQFVLMSQ